MAVQLQWGLEKTSTSTLEIATGLLRAATTDNVQPLAILACEQFGNTLAISPEAIRKVEHTVLPTPKPAVISFLQSTVGYSANDCASQLGKNTAGLQFLAFATALITTMGCIKSGAAIHEMLASTAKDKTLLPTARQVRELLESLEPRCSRASMMQDILGWDKLFRKKNGDEPENPTWEQQMGSHPDAIGIAGLVDALRQLRRIGNEDTDRITIRTGICASWTIAFVKWCIGYPPSVVLPDGTKLLEQAGSEVILELTDTKTSNDRPFCVTVHSYIHGPSELIAAGVGGHVAGMVPMRGFGDFLLRHYGFHTGPAADAFQEAIPYALQQVIQRLRCSADEEGGTLSGSDPRIHLGVSPFPEAGIISQSYYCLFGEDIDLRTTDDRLHKACMKAMPLMASYLSELGKICRCDLCSPDKFPNPRCKRITATERFAILVASILTLSLFDRSDSLQVRVGSEWLTQVGDGFHRTVMGILEQDERSFTCTVDSILRLALSMVGHGSSGYHSGWVMSNDKGQTVWPAMYETFACPQRGFLNLTWLPGILIHKGDVFHRAVTTIPPYTTTHFPLKERHIVARPLNLCQHLITRWDVHALPAELNVRMLLENTMRRDGIDPICVRSALYCMAASLFLERCGHPSDSLLESPDPKARFIGPSRFATPGVVSVVAVNGDGRLRFAALCTGDVESPGKILLRGDACLACCLETCRRTGANTLIL